MPSIKTLAHFADKMHLPLRELIPSGDPAADQRYYSSFLPVLAGKPNASGWHSGYDPFASQAKWTAEGRTGTWQAGWA